MIYTPHAKIREKKKRKKTNKTEKPIHAARFPAVVDDENYENYVRKLTTGSRTQNTPTSKGDVIRITELKPQVGSTLFKSYTSRAKRGCVRRTPFLSRTSTLSPKLRVYRKMKIIVMLGKRLVTETFDIPRALRDINDSNFHSLFFTLNRCMYRV